jgi:hypothetical protein
MQIEFSDMVKNDYKVLICTSTLSVGMNIKDCNIALICESNVWANHQVDQMIGRVGREGGQSIAYVIVNKRMYAPGIISLRKPDAAFLGRVVSVLLFLIDTPVIAQALKKFEEDKQKLALLGPAQFKFELPALQTDANGQAVRMSFEDLYELVDCRGFYSPVHSPPISLDDEICNGLLDKCVEFGLITDGRINENTKRAMALSKFDIRAIPATQILLSISAPRPIDIITWCMLLVGFPNDWQKTKKSKTKFADSAITNVKFTDNCRRMVEVYGQLHENFQGDTAIPCHSNLKVAENCVGDFILGCTVKGDWMAGTKDALVEYFVTIYKFFENCLAMFGETLKLKPNEIPNLSISYTQMNEFIDCAKAGTGGFQIETYAKKNELALAEIRQLIDLRLNNQRRVK